MSIPIFVKFARKPCDFKDVEAALNQEEDDEVKIAETKILTTQEYDAFISDFFKSYAWLAGKGGRTKVIKITAPRRKTIFVDPSGHNYARYVGLQVEA